MVVKLQLKVDPRANPGSVANSLRSLHPATLSPAAIASAIPLIRPFMTASHRARPLLGAGSCGRVNDLNVSSLYRGWQPNAPEPQSAAGLYGIMRRSATCTADRPGGW